MPRTLPALVVLLALASSLPPLAPTAGAFGCGKPPPQCDDLCYTTGDGWTCPEVGPPCVTVRLALRGSDGNGIRKNATLLPDRCGSPHVLVEWNATASSGSGTVTFAFDPDDARLPNASTDAPIPYSPRTASSPLPLPRVVVTAAFDAAWGGDCDDAHGAFTASVNGDGVGAQAPPGLFRDLCRLSSPPDPSAVARAVEAAAAIASGLAPSLPTLDLGALAAGLSLALPTVDATEAPAPPPNADDEMRAAGDATVILLDPDAPVDEAHGLLVDTPLARVEARGDERIGTPGFLLPAAPTDAPASSAPAPPAPLPTIPARAPPAPERAAPLAPPARDARPSAASPGAPVRVRAVSTASPTTDAALAAAATATGALLLLAALVLYQRITKPAALRHAGRAALLRACQETARAATAGELGAAVGMGRQTADYHLRYLARLGHLRVERDAGGPTRFAAHSVARSPAPTATPLDAAVLARVHERPGVSAVDIARELGVARKRVDRRVKDLLVAGLLASRVEGGTRRLYPARHEASS